MLDPTLSREWHASRNGLLSPIDVMAGSIARVWWRCEKGPDHEWKASVAERRRGRGCPFCAGRRVARDRSLAVVAPVVAAEWHPTKNGDLTPADVLPGSGRRVWWRCGADPDHEWLAPVNARALRHTSCPFCEGKRASAYHSLASRFPRLIAEWNPRRNKELRPEDVTPGTPRLVWWQCSKGHEWRASVADRTTDGSGCPFCSHHRVAPETCLAAVRPELAHEWHPTKNGGLTPEAVLPHSAVKVWWKCPRGEDHEWQATPDARAAKSPPVGCPFCGNRRLSTTNSLATRFPALAREWHPQRNGKLTPEDILYVHRKHVWWKCQFGHEWRAVVRARTTLGTGCPVCAGRRRRSPVTKRKS